MALGTLARRRVSGCMGVGGLRNFLFDCVSAPSVSLSKVQSVKLQLVIVRVIRACNACAVFGVSLASSSLAVRFSPLKCEGGFEP